MARLTAAEKQRRYRERLKRNPEKYEEAKRKHREHYHKVKRLAKDLTPKEKKQANVIWKLRQREYRRKRKNLQSLLDATPPSSPVCELNVYNESPPVSLASIVPQVCGRKKVRKDRSKVYRENKKLLEENKKLKKNCEKYKKRLNRIKVKERESKDQKDKQKYKLLTNAIKERYQRIKSHKEKGLFKSLFKSADIEKCRNKTQLLRETLGIDRQYAKTKTTLRPILLQKKIHQFFLRDDVSRATAGKKETVTRNREKVQKRYLLDTMRKLYRDFKEENPGTTCSYYYFTKNRPFYVKSASVDARETCLCKTHANITYKAQALKKQGVLKVNDLNVIIKSTVCSDQSKDCMYNNCDTCKDKKIEYVKEKLAGVIKYSEWIRKEQKYEKDGKFFKSTKNVKEDQCADAARLFQTFENDIIFFKKHVYNIKIQFHNFRKCLNDLQVNECAIVVDFSENYNCKYYEEVQSHHFGGSRNQVSLHTVVVYTYDTKKKYLANSFCTISSSNCHQPAAIWTHLHPILQWVRNKHEAVDTVHFFSDGPSTQYRQKQNFYLLCTKYFDYGFAATTWSFFEAGHGKGPADGIGGFLKRTADKIVAAGTDIPNAQEFINKLKGTSKINLFLIEDDAIKQTHDELPKSIPRLIGTLQVHQIFTEERNSLKYRWLSCFCSSSKRGFCNCLNPKTYRVNIESVSSAIGVTGEAENVEILKEMNLESSSHYSPDKSDDDVPLAVLKDIQNIPPHPSIYRAVYGYSSDSDGEQPEQENLKENSKNRSLGEDNSDGPPATTSNHEATLLLSAGDFLHVFVSGMKKKMYSYVCKALTPIEEDGELKVMFLRVVSEDAKTFRIDTNDVSYVGYEDIIRILPTPAFLGKGQYEFETPIDVFEM
ncbi:unnamed protein product [Euphydryas editha]|uniref:Uncharacterized protein n=1 Tax=Euphydryas editha TaxID=104508 RepID=A0AAU9UUY2_EUPED|nr:unnamed protein product [Euphydryas editha]